MQDERDFGQFLGENAMLAERAFLASIVESSDDAIIGKTLDGEVLSWNAAAEKMYGFSAEEAIGQSILMVVPPDRQEEIPQILARIRRGEIVEHYETKRMNKAGLQIDVSVTVSPIKSPTGEIIGASSITRDITDRKQAQEALQAAGKYSRSLIEASLDPLVTISAEGKITDVNTATERVTGYLRSELVGTDFVDYFTDPSRARAGYQQVFRDGSVQDYELEIRHRDGHLTQVTYNASVYYDESGKIIGLFAAARDISARKQAEMERERLIAELEAKNAELERFTYSVSHDLRSPLITIRTFLGFVAEAVASGNTENLKPDLDRIDKAAEKMGALLNEILELSRVGRLFNPPSSVPLTELVHEALELLSGIIGQLGVEVQISPHLPVVYGDRQRILEVVQNLVENAIKFMGTQPRPKIEIGARKGDGETVLYVRDNGIGISPLYQEKVFGLFNKLDQRTEGTGIGLALVKRTVEVHGGRIWVESEGIDRGSTFCFTLPRPGPAVTSDGER